MTKEEFYDKFEKLLDDFESKKVLLYKEYVSNLTKFNIGDKIQQYKVSIQITGYSYFLTPSGIPDIIYMGNPIEKSGNSIVYGNSNIKLL